MEKIEIEKTNENKKLIIHQYLGLNLPYQSQYQ
jgi:hypothetical protein